ncbi:MAG: DUF922 domain-containing protein [Phyllobacteriaceae bacterium]|nr:DUF922 domain-containing protein [Phyllobacteriaceae bacterium]
MSAAVAALAFAIAGAFAGEVTVRKSYYGFSGENRAEMKSSVAMNGPKGGFAWGLSFIDFEPEWRTKSDGGVCRLADVRVDLRVEMRLPRWRPGFGAAGAVPRHARRFMSAIERHEYGHVAIARRYAVELTRRLSALKTSGGCWPLRSMANAEREAIKPRHLAAHRAYDNRTSKGLKALLN